MNPLLQTTMSALLVTLLLFLLYIAQDLIIPFVIAVVLWYLLVSLANGVRKLTFNAFTIPYPLALVGSFTLLLAAAWGVFSLISANVNAFIAQAPAYQQKFVSLLNQIFDFFGIDDPQSLYKGFRNFDFVTVITAIIRMLTDIASNTGLILLYVLFLLFEHHTFDYKMQLLTNNRYAQARSVVDRILEKIQSYIRLKTLTSLLTGLASFCVLTAVGVDFANFWAFLIFLLNFIPTIGSIFATLITSLFTFVQFGSMGIFLATLTALTLVQFAVGNVLEPRLMGRSFNLSPLVILLALAVWGKLWGIVGMFLCVPILVIATIILASFPTTRPIAVLLSATGDVESEETTP